MNILEWGYSLRSTVHIYKNIKTWRKKVHKIDT